MLKQLTEFERHITRAREGDAEALDLLRAFVAESSRKAPPGDLVDIADYVLDFLRRHVREHVSKN